MLVEKTFQGALIISDLIGGQLVTRQFFGYSKREAMRQFKEQTKEEREESRHENKKRKISG